MNRSRPQTRHSREHKQAQDRSQSRFIYVHEQAASAFSPRQQAKQQSVRNRDQDTISTRRATATAKDSDRPRSDHKPESSTSQVSTRTGIRRELKPTASHRRCDIVVAIAPPTTFPVHIRRISSHVLILIQPQSARQSKNSRRAVRRSSRICSRRKMSSWNCGRSARRIAPSPISSRNIACRRARRPSRCSAIKCSEKTSGHVNGQDEENLPFRQCPLTKPRIIKQRTQTNPSSRPQIQTAMKRSRRALAAHALPKCGCSNHKAHETPRSHPQR